jgi:hypothetical protein
MDYTNLKLKRSTIEGKTVTFEYNKLSESGQFTGEKHFNTVTESQDIAELPDYEKSIVELARSQPEEIQE